MPQAAYVLRCSFLREGLFNLPVRAPIGPWECNSKSLGCCLNLGTCVNWL
jgi:hypothetical protein